MLPGPISSSARSIRPSRPNALSARLTISRFGNEGSQLGYVLAKSAFDDFRKKTDYSEYGGAPLLGIRGTTVIGHGRSNGNAIKNAIRVAVGLCRSKANEKIDQELSAVAAAAKG